MKRNFKIYCEDIIGDGENYILYFVVDGKVIKEIDEGCFDNVLIDLYDFYRSCLDEYKYDSRFDNLVVNIVR